jgi:hypothetical protein
MLLIDREHADRRDDEQAKRPDDHALGTKPVVKHTAKRRANGAGDGEDDAEQAKLGGAPAEHRRSIDAAKSEHGAEPIGVKHPREQEERDLPVMAIDVLHAVDELGKPGSDPRRSPGLGRSIRRKQKQRQDEDQVPKA